PSGAPRLLHNVIPHANEEHIATAAVGSRRHKRIEVRLLQIRQPRNTRATRRLVDNIVSVEGGPSITVGGIPALDSLLKNLLGFAHGCLLCGTAVWLRTYSSVAVQGTFRTLAQTSVRSFTLMI